MWSWILILIFLGFLFGLPILAIRSENSGHKLDRIGFLYWVAVYFGVPVTIAAAGEAFGAQLIASLLAFVFAIAIIYPVYQRYVRRARDAGMGKMIAYVSVIPFVNLVTTLILLFKGSIGTANDGA